MGDNSIFSTEVDSQLKGFALKLLRTPVQARKAMGTIGRERLDSMIPFSEK